ncbi:copper resistance CopC family protein [Microbacterium sp. LWH3-1.2]|uniref:copper resistance CopC family protein n=1 Tax=Microbacterium sp. LWH3-1.2 TaxID=3135256 RepID=UPI003425B035
MSQTLHKPLPARVWAFFAALLIASGMVLAAASPASAHDELLGSDPTADSTLEALPAQLTLTFSAEIADDEGASIVEVTDAAGTSLAGGTPIVRDNVLTQPLAGDASGAVKVLWKVVSSDGHPISGEFTFTIEGSPAPAPTETTIPTPTATAAPTPTITGTTQPLPSQPADSSSAILWPWIIAGVLALAVIGAIAYLLISRSRREMALANGSPDLAAGAPGPDSEPPVER